MDMGLAEELSRLAELKDKGVLTQKEFDRKKKQLLNGGRRSSKFVTIVAGFVAFMAIAGLAAKMFEVAPDIALPGAGSACEIAEVQNSVLEYLTVENKSRYAAKIHDQVTAKSLADISEVYVNSGTGFTACVAKVVYSGHQSDIGYTVTWVDRARGEFAFEISSMSSVLAEYRDVR